MNAVEPSFPGTAETHAWASGLTKREYVFTAVLAGLSANPKFARLSAKEIVEYATDTVNQAFRYFDALPPTSP